MNDHNNSDPADSDKAQSKIKALISSYPLPDLREPQMSHRVTFLFNEKMSLDRKLFFWKALSFANGCLVVFFLSWFILGNQHVDYKKARVYQPVVLHMDYDSDLNEVENSASPLNPDIPDNFAAQIELPKDVVFVSKDEETTHKREMKVGVGQLKKGKMRLPFVVKALKPGKKTFKIKFLDPKTNKVVQEKEVTIKFVNELLDSHITKVKEKI